MIGPLWTALLVVTPLAGSIVAFTRPRTGVVVTLATSGVSLVGVGALLVGVLEFGPWRQSLGGWVAPLGIGWQVDGLAVAMLALTAIVATSAGIYRMAEATPPEGTSQGRYFWPLWLFLWGSLNTLFLSADLFNIYVALEFVSLAAAGLVALAGGTAFSAAWRYFLATLLGSSIYLLGVALLYGRYGTLDIGQLSNQLENGPVVIAAAAATTLGLLLKAAIFPFHFWLPSAHGRATPPVSAILSAIVVAGAFYLLVRLWFGPFAPMLAGPAASLLGMLGAGAILWGGVMALLQRRLKLLIAYSTISQLGYGLMLFPLAPYEALPAQAWRGALVLILAHGLAKAALFLGAGYVVRARGYDRVGGRARSTNRPAGPAAGSGWAWLAFALASASLIGLPPTGGFAGKWWLLQAALAAEAWHWAGIILLGTVLTAAYLWRALDGPLGSDTSDPGGIRLPRALPLSAVGLALSAWALGFLVGPIEGLLAMPEPAP